MALVCLAVGAGAGRLRAAEVSTEFDRAVQPFLTEHCVSCHGEKKQKGELRVDTLSRDFLKGGAAMKWAEIMDRISSGEMPPKGEPKPAAAEAARVVEWLAARL